MKLSARHRIWAYQFPGEFDGVAKGLSIQEYPQRSGGFDELGDLVDSPNDKTHIQQPHD